MAAAIAPRDWRRRNSANNISLARVLDRTRWKHRHPAISGQTIGGSSPMRIRDDLPTDAEIDAYAVEITRQEPRSKMLVPLRHFVGHLPPIGNDDPAPEVEPLRPAPPPPPAAQLPDAGPEVPLLFPSLAGENLPSFPPTFPDPCVVDGAFAPAPPDPPGPPCPPGLLPSGSYH